MTPLARSTWPSRRIERALSQPAFDALVLDFLPEHAAVADWTRPDPLDMPPPWGRDALSLAQYPPRREALGCSTERDAAAKARPQAAGRGFDRALARAAADGDRACAGHRADIAALLAAVARGEVMPPAEALYRRHWHSEHPDHGQGTPVFSAQASFLSALGDWPSKPWYAAAFGTGSVLPMPALDAAGGPGAPPYPPAQPSTWADVLLGWKGWFRRR